MLYKKLSLPLQFSCFHTSKVPEQFVCSKCLKTFFLENEIPLLAVMSKTEEKPFFTFCLLCLPYSLQLSLHSQSCTGWSFFFFFFPDNFILLCAILTQWNILLSFCSILRTEKAKLTKNSCISFSSSLSFFHFHICSSQLPPAHHERTEVAVLKPWQLSVLFHHVHFFLPKHEDLVIYQCSFLSDPFFTSIMWWYFAKNFPLTLPV